MVFYLQFYIRADEDGRLISSTFSVFLLNEFHVTIIYVDHFYVFNMVTRSFRNYPLGDNVGHIFYFVPDILMTVYMIRYWSLLTAMFF